MTAAAHYSTTIHRQGSNHTHTLHPQRHVKNHHHPPQKLAVALACLPVAAAFVAPAPAGASVKVQETKADLEALAVKLNPVVGFYDPLGLADADFWGRGNEYTIGWLRHAEIKHGRVAMAGFASVCICVEINRYPGQFFTNHFSTASHRSASRRWREGQRNTTTNTAKLISTGLHANGIQLPIHIPGDYTTKSPAELWDQVPEAGKWQIVLFVGFLEFFSESGAGGAHYTKGGKPGAFPSFNSPEAGDQYKIPVPLDLWHVGASSNHPPPPHGPHHSF